MQPQFNAPIPPTKPLLRVMPGITEILAMLRANSVPPVRLPILEQVPGHPRVPSVLLVSIRSLPTLPSVRPAAPVRLPILEQVQEHPRVLLAPWASIRCLPTSPRVPSAPLVNIKMQQARPTVTIVMLASTKTVQENRRVKRVWVILQRTENCANVCFELVLYLRRIHMIIAILCNVLAILKGGVILVNTVIPTKGQNTTVVLMLVILFQSVTNA